MVAYILLVFAFVIAVLPAAAVPAWRLNLGWLAFACFVASLLVSRSPPFH